MLHQTYHLDPYLFSTKFSFSSSSSLVEKGEMGRIVKGGLTPKMILETVSRDRLQFNPPSSSVSVDDDFFVDQLLNLNNNEEITPTETIQIQQHQDIGSNSNVVLVNSQEKQEQFDEVKDKDKDTSFLSPPLDTAEEADLEWLSNFVDDSLCPYSTPFPPNYVHPKPDSRPANYVHPKPKLVESKSAEEVVDESTTPLSLRRARRRNRGRTGGRVWAASQSDPYSPPGSPTQKKGTRKRERSGPGLGLRPGFQRRCSHCGVQKTPQWRAGPSGAKTLCNACGVRFKSGRLLPEYRPACSPSFSSELHSNSHRKVMEMRMKNCSRVGLSYPEM